MMMEHAVELRTAPQSQETAIAIFQWGDLIDTAEYSRGIVSLDSISYNSIHDNIMVVKNQYTD